MHCRKVESPYETKHCAAFGAVTDQHAALHKKSTSHCQEKVSEINLGTILINVLCTYGSAPSFDELNLKVNFVA